MKYPIQLHSIQLHSIQMSDEDLSRVIERLEETHLHDESAVTNRLTTADDRKWHRFTGYLWQWQPNIGINHTDLNSIHKKITIWFNDKYENDFINAVTCYNMQNPAVLVNCVRHQSDGFYNCKYDVYATW